METPTLISIDLIDPNPWQPRGTEDPEAVREIAASIKQNGLMQIPTARQVNGHYQLAFGHTRLAAFKLNEEAGMPLIIRDLDDLQMFEMGNAENIKRRDLTIIEKARALKRYMEDFGKTSVEAGEFFGMSEESVRGTVRYLNLPDDVQGKLAKGEITQTIARSLLSLQKIAPANVVSQTVERIQKGKDPRWGIEEEPEEAIENVLESLDEVKEMWQSYRDGKPRGGTDGWLLDMKNFPIKYLPPLTPVDLAIALGIQDDQEMIERALQCLRWKRGMPDMPEDEFAELELPAEIITKLDHLLNPPACSSCPFYSVVDGTHYCGMETCFTRKTRAWEYERLRAASKDLKIDIYNAETDGEFRVLEDNYNSEGKHYKLFKDRNKDLRIALAADIDRKKLQSGYKGVPSHAVVMVVGKTLKNMLASGQKERAEKRTKQQAAELVQSLRTTKREELDWELATHVKSLFEGWNLVVLQALWDTPGRYSSEWETNVYNAPNRPAADEKTPVKEEFFRRLIAYNMVRKIKGPYLYKEDMSEYASAVGEKIKSWGVKLPKSITKLAAQMDEEIAAVTTETED